MGVQHPGNSLNSPSAPDASAAPPLDGVDALAHRRALLLGLPIRKRDTAALLLLALLSDCFIYAHPGGTGGAAMLLTTVLAVLLTTTGNRRHVHRGLLAVLVLAAGVLMWNWSWLLAVVAGGSVMALALRLHCPHWTISETSWATVETLMAAPLRLYGHVMRKPLPNPAGPRRLRLHPILSLVLLPLLVCSVFAMIFIAANPVVEYFANQVSDLLGQWVQWLMSLLDGARLLWWLGAMLLGAALLRPMISSDVTRFTAAWHEQLADDPRPTSGGEFAPAAAVLLCVNVLFLAFNALDSIYLYFKAALPADITYSDYSRRGCFWLTIALALTTVMIGAVFRDRLNFHPRRRLLQLLAYLWAAQNLILAIGALRRLQMYVEYNGLTRLRIVGIYGVLLVTVGLILMIVKVHRQRSFAWLVRRDLAALWIAVVVLALTPRDYLCWTYNAARIAAGNTQPLALLHGQPLSPEALPPLIPLLDYQGVTEDDTQLVRQGVAGLLGRHWLLLHQQPPRRWTQWQGSQAWALAALEPIRPRLDTTARDELGPAEEALRVHTRQWW